MKYLLTAAALLFIGCGNATDTGATSSLETIDMQPQKSYTVFKGDRIVKRSADAQVEITRSLEGETMSAKLLTGDAQLIRTDR